MTVDSYESLYYDRGHEGLKYEIDNLQSENDKLKKMCDDYKTTINHKNIEISRLNKIINKLEEYVEKTKLEEFEKEYGRRYGKTFTQAEVIICNMVLNKIKELKGEK